MDWDGYVRLAFDEIRVAGAGSPQVPRRLAAALEDLLDVAPPERRPALQRQLRLLEQQTEEGTVRAMAVVPDTQGIGSGRDLTADGRVNGDDPVGGEVTHGGAERR
jgi:hypothetical protein